MDVYLPQIPFSFGFFHQAFSVKPTLNTLTLKSTQLPATPQTQH